MSAQTSTLFLIVDLVYLRIIYVGHNPLRDDDSIFQLDLYVRATICSHFYDRKFSMPLVKKESKLSYFSSLLNGTCIHCSTIWHIETRFFGWLGHAIHSLGRFVCHHS